MDIQFYGANCVSIANKQARVVVDDNLAELGGKSILKEGDIALFTGAHTAPSVSLKLLVDQPGEYEVSNISIYGIQARAHMDEAGKKDATMYKLMLDDLRILVTGHVYPELSERQLEDIGMVDIMVVPVGGHGYTTDVVGALKLVKQIEPKLLIPTHYADNKLNFPVPQVSLEDALKELAMEPKESTDKLRLRTGDLGETLQLIVLK